MNKKDLIALIPLFGLIYIYIHRNEPTTVTFLIAAGFIQSASIIFPLLTLYIYYVGI